jgi:cephalosporin hydroxylase
MDELFIKHGTDKNTTHSYLGAYEKLFSPRREDIIRILEIGIYSGASLLAWADYFTHPEAQIVGVDITTEHILSPLDNPKVQMHIFDATVKENIDKIAGNFDFIIDDGSHMIVHQMRSFELLKDRINPGGVYIIEDIQRMDDADALTLFGKNLGFNVEMYDTRSTKGRYDDIMLVFTK